MRGEITYPGDVRTLPLDELRMEAQAQELSYARGEPTHDQAGLELFRRAIAEHDDAAWQAITEVYRGLLIAQASRRVVRGLVIEDDGFCVDRAFQRFWQATRTVRVQRFDDLASILKYLKMCLGSVLLDQARARRRQPWLSIDEISPDAYASADPAGEVVSRLSRGELWEAIRRELTDPKERLVAHTSFISGLCPREILARYPERFDNAFDVYRTKRNMIDRLRRSQAIQRLLD